MANRTNHKTVHRKLKIEQHEPHYQSKVNACAPLVAPPGRVILGTYLSFNKLQ
jgi:hypothetical protein